MKDEGVVWLSICSSAKGNQGFLIPQEWERLTREKGAVPTAVLLDYEGRVGRTYEAKTTPHMFIINPEGVVIYQGAIDSKASVNPTDIPNAKNYVKAALDEAMQGHEVTDMATKSYGCSVKYQ